MCRIISLLTIVFSLCSSVYAASGPVAYYAFDEASGTVALDSSGNGFNGSIFGGSTRVPGISGTALSFDGTTGYVEVPYSPALNASQFSISVAVKLTGGQGTYRSVITSRNSSPTQGFIIYATDSNQWAFWTGTNSNATWNYLNGQNVTLNTWTYLSVTYDGTTMCLYQNGVLSSSLVAGYTVNTNNPLRIGAGYTESSAGVFFPGLIDEVRVYDRPLSAAEVAQGVPAAVSVADVYATAVNHALNVSAPGVLVNDYSLKGKTLSAVLNTNVTNGALALNANGSFTYTPSNGFSGTDSFTYHATDGNGGDSSPVTVTIQVVTPFNVTAMSPAPNSVAFTSQNSITVDFSSPVAASSVIPASVLLVRAGPDGVFDTADDVTIQLQASQLTMTTSTRMTISGLSLPPDKYRFSLIGSVPGTTSSSDAIVTVPGYGLSVPTGDFTVEFWQYFTGGPFYLPTTFNLNPQLVGSKFEVHSPWNSGPDYFFWHFGNTTHSATNIGDRGAWAHFALVHNGATAQVYFNGNLIINDAQTSTFVPYQSDLQLPGLGGSQPFQGRLDEFRIWNVARSQTQIQNYMKRSLTGHEAGLQAYWDFNEGAGTVASDKTGHGFNGTMANPPVWNTSDVPLLPSIKDQTGKILDGEFNGTFPSGDGTAGGDFSAQFQVVPPPFNITAMTPAPNVTQFSAVSSILLTFSANLDVTTVNTNTIHLKSAGTDGIIDTIDDVVVTPSAVTVVNNNQVKVDFTASAKLIENYRITLNGSTLPAIKSTTAAVLDGEYPGSSGGFPSGDGVPGGDFSVVFGVDTTPATIPTTLSTNAVAPIAYGASSVTFSATVTAGQTVNAGTITFQLKNGATNVGSPVTSGNVVNGVAGVSYTIPVGTPVGTCTIFAAYSGGGGFIGSTDSSQQLTLNAVPLSVTANDASRAYGATNPSFTGTIVGIQSGDAITATYASSAASTSGLGGYSIVPTLVDPGGKLGNYSVVSNNGTLTVTAAPLSVTPTNLSRTYGAANPAFVGTVSGVKNGDGISATYATSATPASGVGPYSIVPTLVDPNNMLVNYSVTLNNGTLTVTQAPLTAAAFNVTRTYGAANPVFSGILSGVLNGDNILALYDSTTTPASAIGYYAITPSLIDPNNKVGNYEVTLSNGTLTISKATLSVTPANVSQPYGSAIPALTGTVAGIQNNDNISVTYATNYTPTSPVGNYSIAATLVDPNSKLGNYSVTNNNGTLTIAPAALTVTAADATRVYHAADPVLTGSIVGIQNNDPIFATYSTSATQNSAVGAYPISPILVDSNGLLGNYDVTSVDGTLTITQATPVIAWPLPDRIFAGVLLDNSQLNAAATDPFTTSVVTGAFAYTPGLGTVLAPGLGQTLNVIFTPDDATNYSTASASNTIDVDPAVPVAITSAKVASATQGATFSYSITTTGTAPITLNAVGLPAGFTLTGSVISGIPEAAGVFDIQLMVANYAGSVSQTLRLVVFAAAGTNHAPVFDSPPKASANPAITGVALTLTASATDADGDALDYTWDFGDGTTGLGASVSKSFTVAGAYVVKVVVSDGQASDLQSIVIVVNDQPSRGTFAVTKVKVEFNFIKNDHDSLAVSGTIPLPAAFNPAGKTVRILIGELDKTYTLNAKGDSPDNSFMLKGKIAGASAAFTFTLKKQSLFPMLENLGFSKTQSNPALDFPVVIVLDGASSFAHSAINYTVKSSKNGPTSGIGKK